MYEVTVESGFSSGHYLRNYRGKSRILMVTTTRFV